MSACPLRARTTTANGTHDTVEIAAVVVVAAAAAAAAAATHDVAASTKRGSQSPYFCAHLSRSSHSPCCRSKKEKKHKKEKKSGHSRDEDVAPHSQRPHTIDATAAAASAKSFPAVPAHETDALRLSAKAAAHMSDSSSDGGSDYGPTPLQPAVGDVGYASSPPPLPNVCLIIVYTIGSCVFQLRHASARWRGRSDGCVCEGRQEDPPPR